MKKMTVVVTGASSFTGAAFIKSLAEAGHEVIAPLRQAKSAYKDLKSKRLANIERHCRLVFSAPFGFDSFLNLIMQLDKVDVLCHHASKVDGYKSENFDLIQAVENNTYNLPAVLDCLERKNCQHICLTGTVFEPNEGSGSLPDRAFNLYGLSKAFTFQVFKHYAQARGLRLGKFVISNPFGPWEELKFTSTVALEWLNYKAATLHHPHYVRDNVPISLLAPSYADFIHQLVKEESPGITKFGPSFYAESMEAFIMRFSSEMEGRLGVPCQFGIKEDVENQSEPRVRINTDPIDVKKLGWTESEAWDELANYYKHINSVSIGS